MDSSHIVPIIAIVLLIVFSAYFSATETAFSSLNRIRLKNMASDGNKRAQLTLKIADQYDRLLSTILIGNNIVNICSTSIATVVFIAWLGPSIGPTASTVIMTIVVLIFGEISPKSLAKESPERFAMFSAPILRIFLTILAPLNFLFSQWKRLLSHFFPSDAETGITEDELLTIVDEATSDGTFDEQESDLISSAIEFNDLDVIDVFTPRVSVCGIEDTATNDEISAVFRETGFSRLPVYHDNIDHIVGILHEKDFYNHVIAEQQPVAAVLQAPLYIAACSRRARPIWRSSRTNMAARRVSSRWRISWKSWSARSGMNTIRWSLRSSSYPRPYTACAVRPVCPSCLTSLTWTRRKPI